MTRYAPHAAALIVGGTLGWLAGVVGVQIARRVGAGKGRP